MSDFKFQDIWNATIEKSDRKLVARDYVYASELGGSMIDRYLKMKGTEYTNPPNSRSMRKFMAGDVFEWIVYTILLRAGIKFKQQERAGFNEEGLLRVSGKIDFTISEEQGEISIDDEMPEFMQTLIKAISEMKIDYPNNIIEIKSVGSFVFEGLLAQDNPKTHHMLQSWIYANDKKLPTSIIYICRDDMRILQYSISGIMGDLEKMVRADLKMITHYYKNDIEPPLEKLIIFENGKFAKNWKVEYSNYLSMLYKYETTDEDGAKILKSFEDPMEYYEWVQPIVNAFNRVLKRIKEGKELTKANKEQIEKMLKFGFDIKNLM
jgi:hypothetical protein